MYWEVSRYLRHTGNAVQICGTAALRRRRSLSKPPDWSWWQAASATATPQHATVRCLVELCGCLLLSARTRNLTPEAALYLYLRMRSSAAPEAGPAHGRVGGKGEVTPRAVPRKSPLLKLGYPGRDRYPGHTL